MSRLLRGSRLRLLVIACCVCAATPVRANLVPNGSFETGPAPGDALPLAAGSTAISGWMVTRAGIDYVGSRWTAASGSCSIGLNGSDAGGIATTIATQNGGRYAVRFYLAGDSPPAPTITQMRVTAAGQSADFSFDNTAMWEWDPGWNWHVFSFLASATSTTLEFYSLASGEAGPAIDSVTVELTQVTDVASAPPSGLALLPVAPNPARDASRFEFVLPRTSRVRLSVFDATGREVAVLRDDVTGPGRHEAPWNSRVPAGLYFVELRALGERFVQRMVVLH